MVAFCERKRRRKSRAHHLMLHRTDGLPRGAPESPGPREADRAGPRVLLVLDSSAGWSRGTLRGFSRVALERGWSVLHYQPTANLQRLALELPPSAAVIGPSFSGPWPEQLRGCVSVSINTDRSAEGVASVLLDEARIADLAVSHLLARGFRNLTTFRFDDWGVRREGFFR